MDMLNSANSVILSYKNRMDNFSNGLDDLADSVGLGPFLALMAGVLVLGAGLGGLSVTGIARMDEYFGWPLWSSIFADSGGPAYVLRKRSHETGAHVLRLLKDAVAKYYTPAASRGAMR